MNSIDWIIIETTEAEFHATQLHHKETIFTLGNGYLGTRGSFEEGYPGSCPATLINGVYDDAPIVSPELVNCPNWLPLVIIIAGQRFRLDQGTVLSHQRSLDLYQGVLNRNVRWRSPQGHTLDLEFERFVSLADQHVMALRCRITPIDFAAPIEVHASINGYSVNQGILHWEWLDQSAADHSTWLHVRTHHSKVELGVAMSLTALGANDGQDDVQIDALGFQNYPTLIARFQGRSQQTVTLDKVVTIFTSRDTVTPVQAAQDKLAQLPSYDHLLTAHRAAWAQVWQTSDIVIEGDSTAQLAVRYNLFQLLAAAPRHTDRVSIPAKTLSGFAYRGHIFWDTEIFILPFLAYTQPTLARNVLTYRYHTLAGARRKAQALGYEGAMYVWESADTGDEVTPNWVPDPNGKELVRIWCGDLEVHISTDVAYAIWQYWQATGDDNWMSAYGAEIILDTAVFWSSRANWNAAQDRYEILDVIGPDEFHERVDNNAFTNQMVRWHLKTALVVLDWLRQHQAERADELESQLGLSSDRLGKWLDMIDKLWIPQNPDNGLIEQFQGFFNLEDLNLDDYEPRRRSMQAILGIEGANQRQVLKQADVLMLLYLLREAAFVKPVEECDRQTLQTNWNYYVPRTDHTYGSSLGPPVHAILACDLGKVDDAYDHFMQAALVDLLDVRGNAAEGIHAASAGGVWQTVMYGFAGIRLTADGPIAAPKLPPGWTRLKFQLLWQGQSYEFDLRAEDAERMILEETFSASPSFPLSVSEPLPMSSIQAVIFDLDGVLTDTSEFHYLGWQRLADEEGIPFDREKNEALRGISRRDSLIYLLNGRSVTEEQFQEMMARKNGYYLDLIRTMTPEHLLPGVSELLADLQAAGVKVAIGSSSKNAKEVLQRLGIVNQIDAIADGHSVTQSKPAPDVFLHAAAQLGLDPTTCVVVEDAPAGVEAALRAGMWAIGLGPEERVNTAHSVFPNLAGIRWTDLVDALSEAKAETTKVASVVS